MVACSIWFAGKTAGSCQVPTNVNFSLNRDKIIELRGDGKDDITNKWFIGEPLRVFYDYNVVGTPIFCISAVIAFISAWSI